MNRPTSAYSLAIAPSRRFVDGEDDSPAIAAAEPSSASSVPRQNLHELVRRSAPAVVIAAPATPHPCPPCQSASRRRTLRLRKHELFGEWPGGVQGVPMHETYPVSGAYPVFELYPLPEMYLMPEMYKAPMIPAGPDAGPANDEAGPACQVELVEEIPTGHATPLALEVTTILVDPSIGSSDQRAELPAAAPLALGAPIVRTPVAATSGAAPFVDPAEHLTALLDVVAARAVLAIAEGWHSGQISDDAIDHHLFTRELFALVGGHGGHVADPLAAMRQRVARQAEAVTARVIASLAAGVALPLVELARELELSALAVQLLVAALAPRARREIGRLYRIVANDPDRPACDDAVIATLLARGDARMRDRMCAELADGAGLIRHGLILRDPRGGLDVDDALLARLRGQPGPRSVATTLRAADRTLDELFADRGVLCSLVLELAAPRDPDDPVRIVIRGRHGSGRHATIAALAARVDRQIACIDAHQLPHGPALAEALRRELARAVIGRAIPVISGIEARRADPESTARIGQILRAHPGPLVVRTTAGATVPLAPGHIEVVLAPLSDVDRERAFAAVLERHAISASAERLASRYRIGPGTMDRVAADARHRLVRGEHDATAIVDGVARQHVAARLAGTATRVTRLATWDQLVLPESRLDSLEELIGRTRHGGTVFDQWGYGRGVRGRRGVTALLHGPRGTGKTMVAGAIARALGLELYRVESAKLTSAPGEAERVLDELFGAAEDGRCALLFDDVDQLLAPRSGRALDARHLLHRLEAFDGVAILTTHREAAIDRELGRRLSMRLAFTMPDERLRARLWAAQVTPEVPTAGSLDFAALARHFPLSGADIRSAALRAVFLAAQEGSALSQAHLERAVRLEVRDLVRLEDVQE